MCGRLPSPRTLLEFAAQRADSCGVKQLEFDRLYCAPSDSWTDGCLWLEDRSRSEKAGSEWWIGFDVITKVTGWI